MPGIFRTLSFNVLPNFLASLNGLVNEFIMSSIRLAVLDKATGSEATELFDDESVDKLDDGRICTGTLKTFFIRKSDLDEYAEAPPYIVRPL